MTQPEKKEYLSMDLIDRMVRVEQRVSASFGEYIPYNKTKYYQELTPSERKSYDSFLKNKKIKRRVFMSSFAGIFLFSFYFFYESTGNVVGTNSGVNMNYIKIGAVIFYILLFVILLLIISKRKRQEKSLAKILGVFDRSRKRLGRKN